MSLILLGFYLLIILRQNNELESWLEYFEYRPRNFFLLQNLTKIVCSFVRDQVAFFCRFGIQISISITIQENLSEQEEEKIDYVRNLRRR